MKVETTSIRSKGTNLYHSDLRKMLSIVCYPGYIRAFDTLSVMIVCVRGEVHQHDAYVYQNEPYISIALDYDQVAGLPYEEITVISKNELIRYLGTLESLPVRKVV